MIRVNVSYPNQPGARFDFDYYLRRHIPMVKVRMAEYGIGTVTVDKGFSGVAPGTPPAYSCVVSIAFESVDRLAQGLAVHGAEIMGDIPNYTDLQPTLQISEVLL